MDDGSKHYTVTTKEDGVRLIEKQLGPRATHDDAVRAWDAMHDAGHITHDGEKYHLPAMDFALFV